MSLTPECLEQLGLHTEPFGPVPEDSALYRDALLDGFSELALRALAEPSVMLVLAGAGGVGRSTQLQQILSLLADDVELIAFRARPNVGFEAVDATLRFHLSQLGSEDASASLLHLLGERLRAGRVLLLAIDDAHLLAASVLEHLLSLRRQLLERLGTTARFFLVGDPPFAANPLPGLDAEADAQVLRLHLRAFNREQTLAYMRHRLLTAGHPRPDALLKRELIDRLQRSSSGLPKYLNALAEDWLEESCDHNASFAEAPSDPLPGEAQSARSVASQVASSAPPGDAMVSAMTALEALRNKSSQALEAAEQDAGRDDGSQSNSPAGESGSAAGRGRSGKHGNKSKGRAKPQATAAGKAVPVWNRPWFVPGVAVFSLFAILLPLIWQLPSSDGANSPTRPRDVTNAQRPQRAPLAPGVPQVAPQVPAPESARLQRRELQVPAIVPGDSVAADSAPADATTTAAAAGSAPGAPSTGPGDGDGEGQSAAELAAVGAAPEDSPDASPNGSMESGTQETGAEQGNRETSAAGERDLDRDWILKQSGEHFTIQLTAARSLAAARQHVQGGGNLDVRFVPTRSKSQDFVVVLAGAYPTRADAERALEKLPAALREQGYWIRSVASVRQSLRQ